MNFEEGEIFTVDIEAWYKQYPNALLHPTGVCRVTYKVPHPFTSDCRVEFMDEDDQEWASPKSALNNVAEPIPSPRGEFTYFLETEQCSLIAE